jgi:hypothetical protein
MTTIINGDSNINLDFSTGGRITGDFSNATIANRVLFQSSTTNGQTSVGVLPNGTSVTTNLNLFGGADSANASIGQLVNNNVEVRLGSLITGTGSYLPMTFYTGGTESLRISPTSKAVILAGGSTSANGTGITFPATQSASSDANTLDDYEEGTWSPNVGGNATYFNQFGSYTKVGNIVYASFQLQVNSIGTGSATLISGLPFTSKANPGRYAGMIAYYGSIGTSVFTLYCYTGGSATQIVFPTSTASSGTITDGSSVIFQNNAYVIGSVVYLSN